MGHFIIVTEVDNPDVEVAKLHTSNNDGVTMLYKELDVSEFNYGTNGDGEAEICRDVITQAHQNLINAGYQQQAAFLSDVLNNSESLSFQFSFC